MRFFPTLLMWLILSLIGFASSAVALQDSKTFWVPDDYPNIKDAVDAAEAGDVIRVKAGIYRENLRILRKQSISIIGAGANCTTIEGLGYAG